MKSEIIIFKNVSVKISDKNSLDNLNFSIKSGDFTYLIGKTGSGKSSIIRSIYCDIPIQSGICSIDGLEVNKIKKNQIPFLRRRPIESILLISFVPSYILPILESLQADSIGVSAENPIPPRI